MNGTSKPPRQSRTAKPLADGGRLQQSGPNQGPGYEIGYGKPPEHTRFAKGHSGNPRGRPRKTKARVIQLSDAPFDSFLQTEAYRSVTLRENGQTIVLPMLQAVIRAVARDAVRGKQMAQKFFLGMTAKTEDRHENDKIALYSRLRNLKRRGEQTIATYEAKGLAPPKLLPHPADIMLNHVTLNVVVDGPMTEEDVRLFDILVELRDHLLLLYANAQYLDSPPLVAVDGKFCCPFMLKGFMINRALPKRYRWKDDITIMLMINKHNRMTRLQREQRIASDRAHFKEFLNGY